MISYLLLIIAFGLVILVSIGTLIFGLIKKRKNIIITAAILFVVSVIGCVFSGLTYSKKVYDYVKSKEFQDDAKKGSEIVGQTVGSVSSGISKGLSTTLDDEAISNLANKSAAIVGKSIKTMASSLDSTIGNKNIFMDQNLADAGFELGRADEQYKSKTNDLGIFINYTKDFKGKLKLTNYDQTGKKIDVAEKEINARAGQEQVEVFSFSHSDLGVTTYYIISKVD
jgi:ABC-type transport system involved in multi-copper enzyme maturation permease subunit